jgi:hypothetical protein
VRPEQCRLLRLVERTGSSARGAALPILRRPSRPVASSPGVPDRPARIPGRACAGMSLVDWVRIVGVAVAPLGTVVTAPDGFRAVLRDLRTAGRASSSRVRTSTSHCVDRARRLDDRTSHDDKPSDGRRVVGSFDQSERNTSNRCDHDCGSGGNRRCRHEPPERAENGGLTRPVQA